MATITRGSITITIQPGEQYRVIATGEAYVDIGGGSTESYRLTGATSEKLLGGFIVATPVTVRVVSGSVDYNLQPIAYEGVKTSGTKIYDKEGNLIGPVSVSGLRQFNEQLTASLADGWTCTSYQWTRDGSNISGATSSTYTLTGADIGKAITVRANGLAFTGLNGEIVLYDGPELLRFATAFNKLASAGVGVASGEERRLAGRIHRPIGSSAKKSLRISANNFFLSGIDAITNNPTALTVVGCYVECNGFSVPVTWSGNTSPEFASGASDQLSDKVFPSQFNLTNFNVDRALYIRFELSVPVGGNIPVSEGSESLSTCRSYYVSAGSVNNLSGTGAITFSGTTTAGFEPPFLVLGENVDIAADARCWIGVVDSIFAQGGPSSYFHQACAGASSGYIAGCTIAKVGAVSTMITNNGAVLNQFIKYANGIVDEAGTNQVGSTLSTIQNSLQTMWAQLWANKSTHQLARDLVILRSPLMNRTTGSDGATVFSALWNAGGVVEQLNDWFITQVGVTNRISALAANLMTTPNLMRRGAGTKGTADSDYYKWPAGITGDGLHPSLTGASGTTGLGANLRVYLLANA